MAKYRYTAKGLDGNKSTGLLEAADEADLYAKLRGEGLYLLRAKQAEQSRRVRKIKAKELSEFCREMGTLLQSGVSLVRALNIIAQEETIKPWQRMIYQNILLLIRQGVALSDAIEQQTGVFPELMIYMLRSAEMSGNIDKVMLRMGEHYDKDHKLNSKVINAMIYPAVIFTLCIGAVVVLITFVIPMFSSLFELMDELPLPTRMIMGISDVFKNYWYILAAAVTAIVLFVRWLFRIPSVRLWKDRVKLRLPVVGKLLTIIYTARFTRTLSSLYSSGLPIISALQVGKRTIGNAWIESQFDDAIAEVRGGGNLSSALSGIEGFAKKLPSTLMVGEETGRLDNMLNSLTDDLDYASEVALSRMMTLLEPIMLVFMGVIVLFIMLSILMPIMNSYGAIENAASVY